ncbi:hypothetical protein [Bacillus sp. Marseille-P3661]|uniref:hypothetical protein n=1 Tax=Bacillus sp. Marseille-P3661 TaxID=1936234 RepID=UPI000C825ABF|nr:hypothetical protein [Bacillus sp. Marseille-P3661]
MKKYFKQMFLLLTLITFLLPGTVQAYSYGDPTQEDVAETFKLINVKLSSSPPDWNAAYEAYKVRRAEISSHFGKSVAVTLDVNFEMKQKELVIQNYRHVLYLNLKRRFTYAEKDINDYGKVKILLGKAKGTFDVIKPYVQSKIPGEVSKLDEAFVAALDAIGNPGLFGMGEKTVQIEEFKKQTAYILTTLKPHFPYKESTVKQPEPETSKAIKTDTTEKASPVNQTASGTEQKTNDQTKTEQKQQEQVKPTQPTQKESQISETVEKEDQKAPAKVEDESKAVTKDVGKQDGEINKVLNEEKQNSDNVKSESKEENVAAENEATFKKEATTETKKEEIETKSQSEVGQETKSVEGTDEQVAAVSTAHAPMETVNKTNPIFSFLIIIGTLGLIVGIVWIIKKKNFI